MAKGVTRDDDLVLDRALEICEARLQEAVTARRAADADAAAPRRRLSFNAWRRGALRQGGHGEEQVELLRRTLQQRGIQFPKLLGYMDGIATQIREGHWGGPPMELVPAPAVWNADFMAAATEIATIGGCSLWTAIALAIEDLHEKKGIFGPVDDAAEEERQRTAPSTRAADALRRLTDLPQELLLGMAVVRGVALDPREDLAARLVQDAMAPKIPEPPKRAALIGAEVLGRA